MTVSEYITTEQIRSPPTQTVRRKQIKMLQHKDVSKLLRITEQVCLSLNTISLIIIAKLSQPRSNSWPRFSGTCKIVATKRAHDIYKKREPIFGT